MKSILTMIFIICANVAHSDVVDFENMNIFQLVGSNNISKVEDSTKLKIGEIDDDFSTYHYCSNLQDSQNHIRCQLLSICNYQGVFTYFLPKEKNSNRFAAIGLGFQGERLFINTTDGQPLPKFDTDSRGFNQFGPIAVYQYGIHTFAREKELHEIIWHHRPTYFHNTHACTNAGHCILESLLPIVINIFTWEVQALNDVNVYDNDIILLEETAETCGCATNKHACGDEGTDPEALKLCRQYVQEMIGMASLNTVRYLSDLPTMSSTDVNTMDCWDRAYAGTGAIGPYPVGYAGGQMQQMGPYYGIMRDLVHHRYGQYPSLSKRKTSIFCQSQEHLVLNVTVYCKKGRRTIKNMNDAIKWTQSHTMQPLGFSKTSLSFCKSKGASQSWSMENRSVSFRVTTVAWEGMPMKQQIEQMANTDIYVSSPGSGAMNGLFLPHGSVMITGPLCMGNICKNDEGAWIFQHMVRSEFVSTLRSFLSH